MKTLVLGAGKMVTAILVGLKDSQDMSQFEVYSPSGQSAKTLCERVGATFVSSLGDVQGPRHVWIGCKPQQLPELAESIENLFKEATFVSFLAALPEGQQLKILNRQKLVRAMPNLPVEFKAGITLLSSSSAGNELSSLAKLFSHLGKCLVVSEDELEELTLLTGSGPAFFYEFTHYLSECFSSLDASEREKLARQVLLGAGLNSSYNQSSLGELTREVTSKGGVTIAVLEEWRRSNLKDSVKSGIDAGKKRSLEIKDRLRQN